MRKAALLFAALIVAPAAVQAQVCTGQAPWSSGSVKAGGLVEFGGGFTDILGKLAFGKDQGLFVSVGAGISDGDEESVVILTGGIGKELSKPLSGKVTICPVANVELFLPKNDLSAQLFSAGVSGGYPLQHSGNVALTLTGAAQLGVDHFNNSSAGCTTNDCSSTDILGIFDAGVGIVFNNRVSLVPALRIPTRGDLSLRIAANVAVGKKK